MRPPRLTRSAGILAAFLVLSTACTDAATTTTVLQGEPTTTIAPTTTEPPITTTTQEPTTTIAPDAAPPELRGVWRTEFQGETLHLTLQRRSYSVRLPPETGSGGISVEGDTIEFHSSERCMGDPGGTYTWVIEDGNLTFTLVGQDPCGRAAFLSGRSYVLDSPLP